MAPGRDNGNSSEPKLEQLFLIILLSYLSFALLLHLRSLKWACSEYAIWALPVGASYVSKESSTAWSSLS